MPERTVTQVLEESSSELMALPGVVGIGEGECDGVPCIKVYVSQRTGSLLDSIPDSLDGFDVVVEETGEIRPL